MFFTAIKQHRVRLAFIALFLILSSFGAHYMATNTVSDPYKIEVEVMEKYIGNSRYGVEASMVLRDVNTGLVFDRSVSLSTYTIYNKGDRVNWTVTRGSLNARLADNDGMIHVVSIMSILISFALVCMFIVDMFGTMKQLRYERDRKHSR